MGLCCLHSDKTEISIPWIFFHMLNYYLIFFSSVNYFFISFPHMLIRFSWVLFPPPPVSPCVFNIDFKHSSHLSLLRTATTDVHHALVSPLHFKSSLCIPGTGPLFAKWFTAIFPTLECCCFFHPTTGFSWSKRLHFC